MALLAPEDYFNAGTLAGLDSDIHEALREVNAAMLEGDIKYGRNAWKNGKQLSGDHIKGLRRHLRRHSMGEKYDADSKRRALAHIAARALLALQCEIDEDKRRHDEALSRANGA